MISRSLSLVQAGNSSSGIYHKSPKVCHLKYSCNHHKSRVMRKPTFWFPTWSDTNQATETTNYRRWLVAGNFGFRKQRDCTIYVAKTKALISFAVTAKLICVFVFAYAKCCLLLSECADSGHSDLGLHYLYGLICPKFSNYKKFVQMILKC